MKFVTFIILVKIYLSNNIRNFQANNDNNQVSHNQVCKCNKTISKFKLKVNEMNETIHKLNKENEKFKFWIQNKTIELENQKKINENLKNITQQEQNLQKNSHHHEYDSGHYNPFNALDNFNKSIQYQNLDPFNYEKQIKNVEKIEEVKSKIEDMYRDIKVNFKEKLDNLEKKFNTLDRNNHILNDRLFVLEKEKEKSQMVRNMMSKGGMSNFLSSSTIIEPECVNRNSCKVCLEDPKCTWCNIERKCKVGDMSGPLDGSCMNSFDYSSCSSSNICSMFTSCNECIKSESCGWCDNACIEGNGENSVGIYCPKQKFIHLNNKYNSRCVKSNYLFNRLFV